MPDLVSRVASGMVAFLALHQHVLGNDLLHPTPSMEVHTVISILRSLLSCCESRIQEAEPACALVAVTVLLVRSVEPSQR